jgi:hypothetical protein
LRALINFLHNIFLFNISSSCENCLDGGGVGGHYGV